MCDSDTSYTVYCRILDVVGTDEWRGKFLILSMFGVQCVCRNIISGLCFGGATSGQGVTNDDQRIHEINPNGSNPNCTKWGTAGTKRDVVVFYNSILLLLFLLTTKIGVHHFFWFTISSRTTKTGTPWLFDFMRIVRQIVISFYVYMYIYISSIPISTCRYLGFYWSGAKSLGPRCGMDGSPNNSIMGDPCATGNVTANMIV